MKTEHEHLWSDGLEEAQRTLYPHDPERFGRRARGRRTCFVYDCDRAAEWDNLSAHLRPYGRCLEHARRFVLRRRLRFAS
jgi:hypothetical protein